MAGRRWLWILLLLLMVPGGSLTRGQVKFPDQISTSAPPMDPQSQLFALRRWRALNAERQRVLVADTNKLVRMVTELDAEVHREQPEGLTAQQIHQLAEIERLARSVRERMASGVGVPRPDATQGLPPFP